MLSVSIQVKGEDGEPCERKLPPLKLKAELVYEDNSPAPLRPLCPLRDSQKRNPTLILNEIRGGPRFSSLNHPMVFSFRIEEVSFHHSGHTGFKLHVFPEEGFRSFPIHHQPMDEIVVVLSKPKLNKSILETIETSGVKDTKRKRDSFDLFDEKKPTYDEG